jgi:hypothetical protein
MPSFERDGASSITAAWTARSCRVAGRRAWAGNDAAHPLAISEEVAKLLPDSDLIREWKEGAPPVSTTARMKQFLSAQTPLRA